MFKGYATDAERLAARRESWRRSKQKAYDHYKALCEEADCSTSRNWQQHYRELRPAVLPFERENALLIRRQTNYYCRWWLERHPRTAIVEMGRHLDFLSGDMAREAA